MTSMSLALQVSILITRLGYHCKEEELTLPKLCDKFPGITMLLSCLLCSPATSAPVERVFSCSGLIIRPRMSDSLLESLVMLKCNSTSFA